LFLGQVDVSRCLSEYLAAAEILMDYCKSLGDSVPIIVNTMGFNTGKIDKISNADESIYWVIYRSWCGHHEASHEKINGGRHFEHS